MNDGYLTPSEVATTLRVTLSAVYNWLKSGRLTGYKIGDLWRIKQADLELFIKSNKAA